MKIRLSTVLSGVAVIGVFVTGYFSAKGGEEAARAKMELGDADKKTKRKIIVRCYAKAVVSGAVTMGAIVASNVIDGKTIAKLGGAVALATTSLEKSQNDFKAYRNEVVEEVGEEKEAEIRKNVADKIIRDKTTGMVEGEYRFHLDWLAEDLYFQATKSQVLEGMMYVNKILADATNDFCNHGGQAFVSDFYIGIKHPELINEASKKAGWDAEQLAIDCGCYWLDWDIRPQIDHKGEMYYDILVTWIPWEDIIGNRQLLDECREEELRENIELNIYEKLPFD
jgi:hypothetical protein